MVGGLLERGRDRLVGPVRGLREMPGASVGGGRGRGERGMRGPELGGRGEARHALGEQRMGEPDDIAVDRDQVVVDGRPEVLREAG